MSSPPLTVRHWVPFSSAANVHDTRLFRHLRLCMAFGNQRLDQRHDRRGHITLALLAAACIFITANRLDAF